MAYTLGLPAGNCCGCGAPENLQTVTFSVVTPPCDSFNGALDPTAVQNDKACALVRATADCGNTRLAIAAVSASGSYSYSESGYVTCCIAQGNVCIPGGNTDTIDEALSVTAVTAYVYPGGGTTEEGQIRVIIDLTGDRTEAGTGCDCLGDICSTPAVANVCTAYETTTSVTRSLQLDLRLVCQESATSCGGKFRVYRSQFFKGSSGGMGFVESPLSAACVEGCEDIITSVDGVTCEDPIDYSDLGSGAATMGLTLKNEDGDEIYAETITGRRLVGGEATYCNPPPSWYVERCTENIYCEAQAGPGTWVFSQSLDLQLEITLGSRP